MEEENRALNDRLLQVQDQVGDSDTGLMCCAWCSQQHGTNTKERGEKEVKVG